MLLLVPVGYAEVAADASILLLVGGLSILSLIIVLVVLQSLLPAGTGASVAPETLPPDRQSRPLRAGGSAMPALQASAGLRWSRPPPPPHPTDVPLTRIVETQIGEGRVLSHGAGRTTLRLYGCRGCPDGKPSSPEGGCNFERAAIAREFSSAFGVDSIVREVSCRLRGDAHCDFEVIY